MPKPTLPCLVESDIRIILQNKRQNRANFSAIIIPLSALFNDKIAHLKFSCEIAVPKLIIKSITKSNISIAMICLAYAVLTGCGTKGPLYIPEQRYPQAATQPTPQVVPATPATPATPPAN